MRLFNYIGKHRAVTLTVLLTLTAAVIFAARRISGDLPPDIVRQTTVFNTFAQVKIWDAPSLTQADQAAEEIFVYLYELHDLINVHDPDSELSRLNRKAFEEPFPCSQPLWELLVSAEYHHRQTDGLFDVTIGSIMNAWGFYRELDSWPTEEELAQALESVGMDKVIFDHQEKTVRFTHPGTTIDLGGLAKGYALDKIGEMLKERNIETGMINIGGDILTLEPPEKAAGYRIGVRNPQQPRNLLDTLTLKNRGIATSGNYENFRLIDSREVGHIVHPKTGKPTNEVLSATVIARTATEAEVFATALVVGGLEMARQYVKGDPQYRQVIMVLAEPDDPEAEGRIVYVPGGSRE